jgi:lincosamide nucleotidyltransferase A/C/D/E
MELPRAPVEKHVTTVTEVIDLYTESGRAGIDMWLDGGWGVDALLGEQTRAHEDVDIVVQHKDVPRLRALLEAKGYKDVERDDTSPWNFVLGDNDGHLVDVHAVTFDAEGNGLYGPIEKGVMYPAVSLTGVGIVGGRTVRCISAEYMVKFHTGYKLREIDFKDVSSLCAQFGIDCPAEYAPSQDFHPGAKGSEQEGD